MGKKVKKGVADAVYAKKSAPKANPFATAKPSGVKKINPFEVHLNKEKFQILGRDCKHDKGLPGVSRAKAIQRRAATIGKEFQVKHKSNNFKDRRIGRYLKDDELTEEVLNARFVADKMEKMRANKHSRFNLDDTEVLTHRGQTLEDIEHFRDDRSDEDDDDEGKALDAEFTEAAHFGGDEVNAKDRQAAIDEMILEQKKRKIEIAKEKDEVFELTEKLDSAYKDLIKVVSKGIKKSDEEKKVTDDFDKVMREMLFEPRGHVADKLVTEEEMAMKEKERLEKLEKERLRRMKGDLEEDEEQKKPSHRSADDLDDGYFANGEEEAESILTYNLEGKLNDPNSKPEEEEINSEISADDDEEEESGEEEEDEDSEEDDNLSDLKDSDSENEVNNAPQEVPKSTKKTPDSEKKTLKASQEIEENEIDLPFTLNMPKTYEDFLALISKKNSKHQGLVVERLIKCNHPKLDAVNHEKAVKLFTFLLQYINELFAEAHQDNIRNQFQTLGSLSPFLFDLVHLSPERMSKVLLNVIAEKYSDYRKNPKEYPSLETVIFFKIVSNIYSTSDFRHPVVTPCYVFIQHILSRAKVKTKQDLAIGLFLVTIILEFSQLSKRFIPAAFNYLLGIVFLSIPKRPIEIIKIIPPFESTGPLSKILALRSEDIPETIEEETLSAEDLVSLTFNSSFKIKALNCSLKLIKEMIDLSAENKGSNFLALPFLEMFRKLSLEIYPLFVQNNFKAARESLENVSKKTLQRLVPPAKKPKALRLLEPRIETVYDDKRRPKYSEDKVERLKLMAKVKRETKGAVREIRRDTQYLQKIQIKQQIQSDLERKEKVKRIYQEASVQQGELNELARLKKKKKF